MASMDPGVAFRLRPLSVGDLVDEALKLYRAHFRVLLLLAVLPWLPIGVLTLLNVLAFGSVLQSLQSSTPEAILRNMGQLAGFGGISVLIGLLALVAYSLVNGGITYAVAQLYLGRRVTVEEAFTRVRDRIVPLILAPILIGLLFFGVIGAFVAILLALGLGAAFGSGAGSSAAVGGAVLLGCGALTVMIPLSIFLGTKLALTNIAIVLEHLGAWGGIRRSWALIAGHFWRSFLTLFVLGIIAYFVALVPSLAGSIIAASLPAGSAPALVVQTLTQFVGQVLVTPITLIGVTLLYYDLRVRKEGYDLEVMAQQLRGDAPLPPAPGLPPDLARAVVTRRHLACLLGLLAAVWLLSALARPAPVLADDLAGYRRAVGDALAAAEAAAQAQGAARQTDLARARTALTAAPAAGNPDRAALLDDLKADGNLDRAVSSLRSLQASLTTLAAAEPVAGDRAAQTARDVAARPEFQDRETPLLERLLGWVLDRTLVPLLRWLSRNGAAAGNPMLFIGTAATLLVIGVIAWGFRGSFAPRGLRPSALAVASGPTRSITEQRLAEAAAARGNYRQALHHLYLALLYELDDSGRLRYDPSLTNRELVAASGAEPALVQLVARYDATWYDPSAQVSAEEFARFRDAIERLRPSPPAPTGEATPAAGGAA